MDIKNVKNGNDYMMQMYNDMLADNNQDVQTQDVNNGDNNPQAVIDNSDAEPIVINDDGSNVDVDNNVVTTLDNSSDDLFDLDDNDSKSDQDVLANTKIDFDFSSFAKVVGLDNVDSKEKLEIKVKEIVEKSKELEQKNAQFSSIPEPLKDAIDIYNRGGDYLEYLGVSSISYDEIDDVTMVQEGLIKLGLFRNQDGSIDEESLQDYVDGLDDKELKVRGAEVRAQFKFEQARQIQEIQRKAEERNKKAINDFQNALDATNSVGVFKLKPHHKKEMYDLYSSGKIMKELFGDVNGGINHKKLINIYFREKYGDKIDSLIKDTVKQKVTKDIASSIKNADLTYSGRNPKPDGQTNVDPMDLFYSKLTQRK